MKGAQVRKITVKIEQIRKEYVKEESTVWRGALALWIGAMGKSIAI